MWVFSILGSSTDTVRSTAGRLSAPTSCSSANKLKKKRDGAKLSWLIGIVSMMLRMSFCYCEFNIISTWGGTHEFEHDSPFLWRGSQDQEKTVAHLIQPAPSPIVQAGTCGTMPPLSGHHLMHQSMETCMSVKRLVHKQYARTNRPVGDAGHKFIIGILRCLVEVM